MDSLLTPANITFAVGMLGILFSVYNYFRNPQIKGEKDDALIVERARSERESVDFRFRSMQDSFQQLLLQSNNHIHTVDTKVEALTAIVGAMSNEITKLSTIIAERIPKNI